MGNKEITELGGDVREVESREHRAMQWLCEEENMKEERKLGRKTDKNEGRKGGRLNE